MVQPEDDSEEETRILVHVRQTYPKEAKAEVSIQKCIYKFTIICKHRRTSRRCTPDCPFFHSKDRRLKPSRHSSLSHSEGLANCSTFQRRQVSEEGIRRVTADDALSLEGTSTAFPLINPSGHSNDHAKDSSQIPLRYADRPAR